MIRGWQVEGNRFENARKQFNFDPKVLSFASVGSAMKAADDELLSTTDVASASSRSDQFGTGAGGNSATFQSQLKLEPSQRLTRTSSQIISRRRSRSGSFDSNELSSDDGLSVGGGGGFFNRDQLATQDVTMIGREKEVQMLLDNTKNSKQTMVTVIGPSGSGKSMLVREYVSRYCRSYRQQLQKEKEDIEATAIKQTNISKGIIACSGKFDIQNRAANPYAAVGEAINDYVEQVCSISNKDIDEGLSLDEEYRDVLVEIFPSMKRLFDRGVQDLTKKQISVDSTEGPTSKHESGNNKGTDNTITERGVIIQTAFQKFIRAVLEQTNCSLILVLDDMQWASPAVLGLLESLLQQDFIQEWRSDDDGGDGVGRISMRNHFHLVTTCRSEYFEELRCNRSAELSIDKHPNRDSSSLLSLNTNENENADDNNRYKGNSGLFSEFLDKYQKSIYQLRLQPGLPVESVQIMVNTLLRMDSSSTSMAKTADLAAIVHSKTSGNPFFIVQFMQSLVNEGMLKYNMGAMKWEWYEVEIQSHNVAKNVQQAVSKQMRKLSFENLLVLQVASCLSRTFEYDTIQFVLLGLQQYQELQQAQQNEVGSQESSPPRLQIANDDEIDNNWDEIEFPHNLYDTLTMLVERGLIESQWTASDVVDDGKRQPSNVTSFTSGRFAFSHDQIQQAAFESIPSNFRVALQVAIGKRLIQGLDSYHMEQFLFTAVELCGHGLAEKAGDSRHLLSPKDKEHFAFWTFIAGNTALRQGAFDTALRFFNWGESCLGDDPFKQDSELALPMFNGTIFAAYGAADLDTVRRLSSVIQQQKCISAEDKMQAVHIDMKLILHQQDYVGTVAKYRRTIKSLGAGKFPKTPTMVGAIGHLLYLANKLKRYDQKKLLALPVCTDQAIIAASGVYSTAQTATYLLGPSPFIISAAIAMRWSLKHGVTKYTPIAWSAIAVCMTTINIDIAMELGESSLALCEQRGYKEALPFALHAVYGFVRHFKYPLQEFVSPFLYGIDLAKRHGDLDILVVLMGTYSMTSTLIPTQPIPALIQRIAGYHDALVAQGDLGARFYVEGYLWYIRKLADAQAGFYPLSSKEAAEEAAMRQRATEKKDLCFLGLLDFYVVQLMLFYGGDPIEACKIADRGVVGYGVTEFQGTPNTYKCTFVTGMVRVLAYQKTKRGKYLRGAKAMRKRMQTWISKGNPNVLHLNYLLEAEIAAVQQKTEKAKNRYREAISSSIRCGYKLDFAYANERCSIFYQDILGDTDFACRYMEDTIKAYEKIGAMANVEYLYRTYPDLSSPIED